MEPSIIGGVGPRAPRLGLPGPELLGERHTDGASATSAPWHPGPRGGDSGSTPQRWMSAARLICHMASTTWGWSHHFQASAPTRQDICSLDTTPDCKSPTERAISYGHHNTPNQDQLQQPVKGAWTQPTQEIVVSSWSNPKFPQEKWFSE